MKPHNKLIEITDVLNKIHAEADTRPNIDTQEFLDQLDNQLATRPSHINDILRAFASRYPTDLLVLLDAYLRELETAHPIVKSIHLGWDFDDPPYWSHQQAMKRQQRRNNREMKKILNTY